MGFIAGIASRDGHDVSQLLGQMAKRLSHRGNSEFCFFSKRELSMDYNLCRNIQELLTVKTPFGIVGRYVNLNGVDETIPYANQHQNRFLLLDGRVLNMSEIAADIGYKESEENSINMGFLVDWIERLQQKNLDFTKVFEKFFAIIEGMFAGVFFLGNHIFLFCDVIGIKTLYLYSGPDYIAFASEKKALWSVGFTRNIEALRPGRVVRMAPKGFTSHYQARLKQVGIQAASLESYVERLQASLERDLKKLLHSTTFHLLLSGGIDSTILAGLCEKMDLSYNALVTGSESSKDLQAAQQVADIFNKDLEILKFDRQVLEEIFPALLYHIEDPNEKKLNIAFPLFYGTGYLKENQGHIICTGQGADELFGGYERHELEFIKGGEENLQKCLWDDVNNLYTVNLQRDDLATMAHGVELRLPYLMRQTVELAMQIPPALKIHPPHRKYILRKMGERLGLPKEITLQPKRAIQFSSGSYAILKKLAKYLGFTKDFVLQHGFFSPTQTFIDSAAHLLGFPDIDPKIVKLMTHTQIEWPESFLKYQNIINKTI